MTWERLRIVIAWPFLVLASPLLLLAAKVGGVGIRYSIADLCEQILEGKGERQARPYRAIPEKEGDRRTSSTPHREIEFAPAETVLVEVEADTYAYFKAF
jgi:hypothetical protein